MLSIENPPPPPDSSCSSQALAQLRTSSDEIDLLKKQSLDHHHHQHTPLPKFSIRDYVFISRSKDIKKNWPFSPKNLQLCLKRGLKDPLPPFQPLDAVRNQSVERCVVETDPFGKQSTRKSGEEPSRSNDHVVVESSNDAHSKHILPSTCIDNSSCRIVGEHGNDLPSTTASVSQSDIDSVLVNKQSKLPLAAGKTRKSENTTRSSSKKCSKIVKFGGHSDRSSTEDITSNSTMLSESMASKVCPVCKTFSSSSNTTFNAHIDRCLSDESTRKWTVDSKLTRHRIKPRKTRLMVDVYATAKPCTLEELDRRNGTSWATASNIPRQDTGDVGAVYFDANGTKIRILSKSNEVQQVSKDGDDPGPSKALEGSKGTKFISTKKKRHGSKHHKYLKLASQSRKLFSHKTCSSMVQSNESHQGVRKLKSSYGNPISSPEKYEKTVKPVYEAPNMEEREHSFGRKRVRSSLCGPRVRNKVEPRPLKRNANQLSEDHPRLDKDRIVRSMNSGGNYSSSLSKTLIDSDANSNPDTPVTATTPSSDQSFAFKGSKKNVSSASSKSSMVKSWPKNHLSTESQLHFMAEIDEEEVSWGPESDQDCDLVHDGGRNLCGRKEITEEISFGGSSIQGSRSREQRGRKTICRRDESMALKSIHWTPHCYDSDEAVNSDFDSAASEDILEKVDGLESIEETVTRLTDLIEPGLGGKPHMFCGEVSDVIIGQTDDMVGEPDSDVAQLNSFPEVDPIPIRGPPGSFLPSPRDMATDDFQGISSLDTARIDSQDQLDMVDEDSSDSTISAVSTISNSVEAKSEPLAFEGAPAMLEKYRPGYSSAKSEPLVENGAAFPYTSAGLERTFEGEKFRVHRMSFEKRPLIFTNDDQPCCCQRKDRSSQDFTLNYPKSQLLRQQTMPSMMVPAMGMQIAANQNIGPDNFDARPEANPLSSNAGAISFRGFSDAGVKLSVRSDCNSATPSSSNPVLRLMGKNLMVVNKEEDASMPHDNIHNQGGMLFQRDLVRRAFDVQLTNGYRNHANLGTPQTPAQLPAGMFFDERMDCGLTTCMELYNRYRNGDSAASSKEVIVIDDAPEGSRVPLASNHSVKYMNPFSRYRSENSLLGDANFNATPSRRANTVPVRSVPI